MNTGPSQCRTAIVLLIFLVLMWGCNWPINKTILTYISPLWYACVRLGLGAFSLFLAQALLTVRIKPPSRVDIPIVLSVGVIQMAAVIALMTFGLSIVPAGRSSILSYTMPLWAVPGAIVFLGERLQFGKTAALVLGTAGVAFMFNPTAFDWSDHLALLGNGCLLLAAALWAAIIHIRAHRWVGTSFELAPWQMLVGLIPLVAVAWWVEGPPPQVSSDEQDHHRRSLQRPLDYSVPVLGVRNRGAKLASDNDIVKLAVGTGNWAGQLRDSDSRANRYIISNRSPANNECDSSCESI